MTFLETYQGRKTAFANKLVSKGVSASGSDGLTTLINKIDDIQHQTKGIIVSSEKKIAQSGDDVDISAYILNDDGTFVPDGTPAVFEGLLYDPSGLYDNPLIIDEDELVWHSLGDDLTQISWALISTTPDTIIYMGQTGSSYFTFYKTSTGWNISYKDNGTPTSITGDRIFQVKKGLITNGNGDYVDLSTVNGASSSIVSSWYGTYLLGYIGKATLEVYKCDGSSSSGMVDSYISCTGAGLRQFRVFAGRVQSEPYSILDTLFFDGMEDTTYENYYKFNNTANLSYSTDWAVTGSKSLKWDYATNTGAYNYWGIMYYTSSSSGTFAISSLLGESLRFKVDVKSSCDFVSAQNKGFYIGIYCQAPSLGSGWKTLGTVMVNSGEHTGNNAYHIDFNVPSDATSLWVRFNVAGTLEDNTLYVDNWKLYPI